jgi:hypothetical protein
MAKCDISVFNFGVYIEAVVVTVGVDADTTTLLCLLPLVTVLAVATSPSKHLVNYYYSSATIVLMCAYVICQICNR